MKLKISLLLAVCSLFVSCENRVEKEANQQQADLKRHRESWKKTETGYKGTGISEALTESFRQEAEQKKAAE